jgi:hypothetical protein
MRKCQAIKGNGTRCQRIVTSSSSYCYSHDPARQEERKRNAQRGGRVKGTREVTKLKLHLQQLADDTLAGEVDRGVATTVNQIYGTILGAIRTELKVREVEELVPRLEELEAALQKRKNPYGTQS